MLSIVLRQCENLCFFLSEGHKLCLRIGCWGEYWTWKRGCNRWVEKITNS